MKRFRKTCVSIAPVAFIALALTLGACSNQPTTPTTQDTTSVNNGKSVGQSQEQIRNLLVPLEDIARFESNSPIWKTISNDQIVDDQDSPLYTSPAAISDAFFEIYSVRAVWGRLSDVTPGSPNPVMDWSGGMGHNSAAMMVLRSLIDFEHGEDSVFRHDNIPGIAWKSQTGGDDAFDGVHVELYHPKDVVYIMEPRLIFKAGPVELDIPFSELAALDTVIVLSGGAAVSIQARLVRQHDCPDGYLAGAWVHKDRSTGHFFGKWIASDGQPMGYLRGEFATTEDGARWFQGKWFSTSGDLQGYLKGEWGFAHDNNPHPCLACDWRAGWFRGDFSDVQGNLRGRMHGRFGKMGDQNGITPDGGAGLFFGKWEVDCRTVGSN